MHTHRNRLLGLVLLTAIALALTNGATAADRTIVLKKGSYKGLWHGDKVTFDVEKVSPKGKFSGIIHFDEKGPWKGEKSNFTAEIDDRDAIIIKRPDSEQMSKAGPPKKFGKFWLWKGHTSGKDVDKGAVFELQIPR
jgi:hypothetical protein